MKINLMEREETSKTQKDTYPVIIEYLLCVWGLLNETASCTQEAQSLVGAEVLRIIVVLRISVQDATGSHDK